MKAITQLYVHIRLDTGEIFYVGIGMGDRPWHKKGRNQLWERVVAKCGYRVEILEEGLSWYQACELEKMLIALYGRRDLGTGPLVNMTDGGDGALGRVPYVRKAETLKKQSDAKIGVPQTAEHRANRSASMKGKNIGNSHNKGKTRTPATKAKMSAARKAYLANKLEKTKE
jgi:hypothetical protein